MFALRNFIKSPAFGLTPLQAMQRYAFGLVKFNLPDLGEKIK